MFVDVETEFEHAIVVAKNLNLVFHEAPSKIISYISNYFDSTQRQAFWHVPEVERPVFPLQYLVRIADRVDYLVP
jgi:hypothetical protein